MPANTQKQLTLIDTFPDHLDDSYIVTGSGNQAIDTNGQLHLPFNQSEQRATPAAIRHVGQVAIENEIQRAEEIAELRGDDLYKETTGRTVASDYAATGTTEVPRTKKSKPTFRRRTVGGQRPEAEDASLEGTTHEELYPDASVVIARLEDEEQAATNARGMDLVRQAYNPPKRGER